MSQTDEAAGFDHAVGRLVGHQTVRVERAPIAQFARAIGEDSDIYLDLRAAQAAGFDSVPIPATFPFAMGYWGAVPELQPEGETELDLPPELSQLGHIGVVMAELIATLGPGLVLHAEQDFEYQRQIVVGDVLTASTRIAGVETKKSRDSILTFVAIETEWTDAHYGKPVLTSTFTAVHRAKHEPPTPSSEGTTS